MSSRRKEGPFAFLLLHMFYLLLAALAETAQRRGQDPLRRQRFPAIITKPEPSLIDACQHCPDVLNDFPIPVAYDQSDSPVKFDSGPIKGIRQFHAPFFHFINHFVACHLQLIHLPDKDVPDILDFFPLHFSSSITRRTFIPSTVVTRRRRWQ